MRHVRDSKLETRTARAKLKVSPTPYYRGIEPGLHLGYRKLASGPGTWVARRRVDGRYVTENLRGRDNKIILADDFADADNISVLDYWQAQDRAREVARADHIGGGSDQITVAAAIERYEASLKQRGGDVANAARIRLHLPNKLGRIIVAKLVKNDFAEWKEALADLSPASRNRINAALKAALNLAADEDERIAHRVWKTALKTVPDATEARNVVLPDPVMWGIVDASYDDSAEFGLFVETAAVTGARPSQIGRLLVRDLQADGHEPRLMMPSSKKGRGSKKIDRVPVPITADLALRLRTHAKGRSAHQLLLLMPGSGKQWRRSTHTRYFTEAVQRFDSSLPVSGDEDAITIYAMRHTSITRQLMRGVPVSVVAATHDTSEPMIRKHYAAFISDHTDALSRQALPSRTRESNVVSLKH